MKLSFLHLFVILFLFVACSQPESAQSDLTAPDAPDSLTDDPTAYDSAFAAELGADEFGMKPYIMVFLYRGENQSLDSVESAEVQKAHLDNIRRLAEANKLALAGPFLDKGDLRGIFIFNSDSLEEVQALTEADPAVEAGVLRYEMVQWYGSAALQKVNKLHLRAAKVRI